MMLRFGNFSSRIAVPKVISSHFRVGVALGFTSMRTCSSSSQQYDDPDHLKKLALAFAATVKENNVLFRTPHGVETILDVLETVKSPKSFASMADSIQYTASTKQAEKLFTTPRATKVILDALSRSATPESVERMSEAILWITSYSLKAKKLYSTPDAVKIILDAFHRATTSDSASRVALVVWSIVHENPEGQKAFTTPQAVAAFKSIVPIAKNDFCGVYEVSAALKSLFHENQAAIELFGTQDFLYVFTTMSVINDQKYHDVLAILKNEVNRKNKMHELPLEIARLDKEIVSFKAQLEAKEKLKKEKQTEIDKIKQ